MPAPSIQPYLSAFHLGWLAAHRPRPATERLHGAYLLIDVVGFTAITQRLSKEGARGAERLNEVLNHSFGRVVNVIEGHGGDVITFAGDAVLAAWPARSADDLEELVLLAAQAGLAVQQVQAHPELSLELRGSVGAGPLSAFEVGGVDGRWMLVAAGTPLVQVARADEACRPGEVVVAREAWPLIAARCGGEPRGEAGVQVTSVDEPVRLPGAAERITPDEDLGPYVPAVVRQRAGQESYLAEFRRLSILFVNLSDFDPAARDALDSLQAAAVACQEEVRRTGGVVYNFLTDDKGTSFMAAWGLPGSSHEDDAVRAVGCALRIRERLGGAGMRSAVGVATGRLFCGSYGNERRRHYTIVGPTINLAARLMVASEGDGLLCDGKTAQAAAKRGDFEDLPPISAKGLDQPVAVHRPLGLRARQQAAAEEMVGRAQERAHFAQALDELAQGGGVHLIVGEAGIGKSQLLHHVVAEATERGHTVLRGAGDSIENRSSWLMWRDPLRQLLGQDPSQRALQLLGGDERLLRWAPLLGDVLDLELPTNETTAAMSGPARADAIADLLAALLDAASREGPCALVVEDAHWLDTASWAGLLAVATRAKGLLLVASTRPLDEQAPAAWDALRALPSATTLSLDSLSPDDAAQLACRKLGVDTLPAPITELLARQAGGHPLYTQELAWALVEEGALAVEGGQARLLIDEQALGQLGLPDSLEGVITGRIDQLGSQGQLLLKVASVIGRVFGLDVLEAVAPVQEALKDEADELVEHDLVLPEREEPDLAWIFKHALVRDTAYGLLVFAQRRRLHRAVAEWYEQARGASLASHYPVLAHHYALAEVPDKAREYLGLAGSRALRTGASAEAVSFFQRALELEEAGRADRAVIARQAGWWRRIGLGYYALGKKGPARDAMLKTLELVGRPLRRSVPGLLMQLMGQYLSQARWLIAPESMVAKTEIERQLAAEAADAAQYVSTTYYFDKENLPFFVAGLKCASEAARAGATAQSAVGLAYVGVLAGLFQIDRLTMTYFRRSLAIAEQVGDPSAVARHWQLRAMQRAGCGEWIEHELEQATRFFERTGDRHEYEVSVTVQALIATYRGEYGRSLELYGHLVDSARGRSVQHTVWGTYKLGEQMLLEDGRHDDALPSQLESLELLAIEPEEPTEAAINWLVGAIRYRQGDKVAASDTIHRAFERVKKSPPNTHGMLMAYTLGIWTLLDLQDEDPTPQARKRVRFALGQMGVFAFLFPFAKGRLSMLKARNALAAGKNGKAQKLLTKAIARGEKHGMKLDVALAKLVQGNAEADAELDTLGATWFTAWGRARR